MRWRMNTDDGRWKLTTFYALGVVTGLALSWVAAWIGCAAVPPEVETSVGDTFDVPIVEKA